VNSIVRSITFFLARHARLALVLFVCAWPSIVAASQAGEQAAATATDVPKGKQTTLGLYMTAAEAYDAWKADSAHVRVLDVRTPEEYLFVGHPEMAWNIPLALQSYAWDEERKHFAMKPNPDFLAEVKAWAKPDDRILVMCRSGGRSARACDELAEAGFTNVYTIVDGMEGDVEKDPASPDVGKRVVNGWKNAGLPWTYKVDHDRVRWPEAK